MLKANDHVLASSLPYPRSYRTSPATPGHEDTGADADTDTDNDLRIRIVRNLEI